MKHSTFFLFSLMILLTFTSCTGYQKLVAYDHIDTMQSSGALLVTLKSEAERVDRLERYGRDRKANRVQRKNARNNQMVMETYRNNFGFCPVYFCYEEDRIAILQHWEPGNFVNGNLERDPGIQVDFENTDFFQVSIETVFQSVGDNDEEVEFLIIRDANGNTLPAVFPGEEEIGSAVSAGLLRRAVRNLERRLNKFYTQREQYMVRRNLR